MPDAPHTVSFSEAQACPQCGHNGKIDHTNPIMGGAVHKLTCMNEVCPWYRTSWMVETNANGEVQVNEQAWKTAHGERLIAPRDPSFDAAFEAIHGNLARQLQDETRKDT
jgi:hypothetical protein